PKSKFRFWMIHVPNPTWDIPNRTWDMVKFGTFDAITNILILNFIEFSKYKSKKKTIVCYCPKRKRRTLPVESQNESAMSVTMHEPIICLILHTYRSVIFYVM